MEHAMLADDVKLLKLLMMGEPSNSLLNCKSENILYKRREHPTKLKKIMNYTKFSRNSSFLVLSKRP